MSLWGMFLKLINLGIPSQGEPTDSPDIAVVTEQTEIIKEIVEDDFINEANKFRVSLPKNKKAYFGRLISAYKKAESDDDIASTREKVEKYISKNS